MEDLQWVSHGVVTDEDYVLLVRRKINARSGDDSQSGWGFPGGELPPRVRQEDIFVKGKVFEQSGNIVHSAILLHKGRVPQRRVEASYWGFVLTSRHSPRCEISKDRSIAEVRWIAKQVLPEYITGPLPRDITRHLGLARGVLDGFAVDGHPDVDRHDGDRVFGAATG